MVILCTTRSNIPKFCFLCTQVIYVFYMDLKTNINFSIYNIKLLVFTSETWCLLRGTNCNLFKFGFILVFIILMRPLPHYTSNCVEKIFSFKFVSSSSCKEVVCPLWRQKLHYNIQNDTQSRIQPSSAMDYFL